MSAKRKTRPRRGARVRVRRREGGLALEIDGTWASHRRPGEDTTASVWDAVSLPFLALGRLQQPRVLILGLGGGSVARVIRAISREARIVGVEFDAEVIRVARRSFGLDELAVEVVYGDARAFLRRTRRRFDLVVDDVFVGSGETPRKPEGFPSPGLRHAAARLAPGGVLVSNSLDEASEVKHIQCSLWRSVLELRVDGYDNRIFAGSERCLEARALRRKIAHSPLRGLPGLRIRGVPH